jgi:hypothetical protein
LRCYDKKDMAKGKVWIARHDFWELSWERSNDWWELAKQDISDEALMLYQSMNEAWHYSCEFDHISGN